MEFSAWPNNELEELAKVYVKHKQFQRAERLRLELASRLAEAEDGNLRVLFEQLDNRNVVSLADRIFGRSRKLA
jgi:hypothetical protein